MYPITFKKERAAHFLDCLLNGRPMLHDPEQPDWTVDEMLQLAGACFFAVAAHGPIQSPTAAQVQKWAQEHPEHREAEIETLLHDLHAAMDFIAQLNGPQGACPIPESRLKGGSAIPGPARAGISSRP